MKRLVLRFQTYNSEIIAFAIVSALAGFGSIMTYFESNIEACIILAIFSVGMFIALLWYILHTGIAVFNFNRNYFKIRSRGKKSICTIDEIRKMEIMFQYMKQMKCYSAQVKIYLNSENTITVKFEPKTVRGRYSESISGGISLQKKTRIENQVQGIYFITCRTI